MAEPQVAGATAGGNAVLAKQLAQAGPLIGQWPWLKRWTKDTKTSREALENIKKTTHQMGVTSSNILSFLDPIFQVFSLFFDVLLIAFMPIIVGTVQKLAHDIVGWIHKAQAFAKW